MAHAVGIAIRTTKGCPHLRATVVDVSTGQLVSTFEFQASEGEVADQVHQIAQDLASELTALDPIAVLIREVGFARKAGMTAAVKTRIRAEGACVGVARAVTSKVAVMETNGIAHLLGVSGSTVDNAGTALTSGKWVESATAAVAAARM